MCQGTKAIDFERKIKKKKERELNAYFLVNHSTQLRHRAIEMQTSHWDILHHRSRMYFDAGIVPNNQVKHR